MISKAHRTASAANPRLSTGPRTAEGKARSSQNARTHGLTAAELIIAAEDREEFDDLHARFHADVRPQGALQQTLFDQLVAAAWNLRRVRRLETELCSRAATYHDLLADDDLQAKLDRLARHQSRLERAFHRSLKELKALQTNAALQPMISSDIREAAPPLASATEIAKRTRQPRVAADMSVPIEALELHWAVPDAAAAANMRPAGLENQAAATAAA